MNLDFTPDQMLHRKSVAEFLKKECPFEVVKQIEESAAGYSHAMWKKMAALDWMRLGLPEQYGGFEGASFTDLMITMEEMGKAAYPGPFFSTVIQCGLLISEAGSHDQKNSLLNRMASGDLIMALAQYEKDVSYHETGITMPAEPDGDGFCLDGTKLFALDANIANKLIVAARIKDAGVTLFLVEADSPGVSVTKMPGIGMDNLCEVAFEKVKVPGKNMIGNPGDGWKHLEKMFHKALVAKSAEMIGGCKKAIEMTVKYAKERVQYGRVIGGFQVIQHYLANMLLGYDTTVNYLHKIGWMIDEGMDISKEAHGLKARVNEQYKYITERGVQIHGGVGVTREFDIGLFYRRAKAFELVLGDTNHHYDKLAEALAA